MGVCIVITSGKGGTGKTTAVAALSSCLAALGKKTLCIDGDVGLKNLDLALGLAGLAAPSFLDLLSGEGGLEEVPLPHPEIPGLFFLTAPQSAAPEDIDPLAFSQLLRRAAALYDYVFVDAPAGIGAGFRLAAAGADEAIVVSNGDPSSLRDAQKTVLELEALGLQAVTLLANRISRRRLKRALSTVDDIIDGVGARLIGLVPEDRDVPEALACCRPLVLYSSKGAAKAFLHTAKRLEGMEVPPVHM